MSATPFRTQRSTWWPPCGDWTMPSEYSWMLPLSDLCSSFPASGSSFRSSAESFCVNQSDVLQLVRNFSRGIWHERVEVSSVLLGLSLTHKDVLFHGMLIPLFLSGLLAVILCTSVAGMITRDLWYLWISLTEMRAFPVCLDLRLHPNTSVSLACRIMVDMSFCFSLSGSLLELIDWSCKLN